MNRRGERTSTGFMVTFRRGLAFLLLLPVAFVTLATAASASPDSPPPFDFIPQTPSVHMVKSLISRGDTELAVLALARWDTVVTTDTDRAECLLAWSYWWSAEGQLTRAAECAETAIRLNPMNTEVPTARFLAGYWYHRAGQDSKALGILEECVRPGGTIPSYHKWALVNLAEVQHSLGFQAAAVATAQELVTKYPETVPGKAAAQLLATWGKP